MDLARMMLNWRQAFARLPPRLRHAVAGGTAFALLVLLTGTGYVYEPYVAVAVTPTPPSEGDDTSREQTVTRLRTEQHRLRLRLARLGPQGLYIVIDQSHNRLYLHKDARIVMEALCSSGSGLVLKESQGGRHWVFDTPRGRFKVLSKIEDPVWKKPDWAFVEEGQPIPKNPEDRFETGALGEYAFYLGDGYLIHGTLYERLLGRSVTHGCIRLGRDDLRALWTRVPVGTPVYIY